MANSKVSFGVHLPTRMLPGVESPTPAMSSYHALQLGLSNWDAASGPTGRRMGGIRVALYARGVSLRSGNS
jgi:hypothetical protein